jgi:hypothetical protein
MKRTFTSFGLLLTIPLLLTVISSAVEAEAVAADEQPTATLTIDETQVMLILGGEGGGGVLVFGDESYAFKTGGIKLGGLGIHKIHLVGDVYGLTDIADFAGTYFEGQFGLTIVKGKGGMWLGNHNDVKIHLKANADGIAFSTGIGGLKLTME